jgi:threonine dehydratase
LSKPPSEPPIIADIRAAAGRIAGQAIRTPLLYSPWLSERLNGRIFLKCENLQRTGSFKFRGAYNALAALGDEERGQGVVAVSSGNHAQGVAEAARIFGVAATIVMPADAPATKRAGVISRGGRIVDYIRASEDRDAVAAGLIAREGGSLVHPYNDPLVIAGQGTIGLEIAEDAERLGFRPDAVLVPCGGGGLSAGIGVALRAVAPATEIFIVEPRDFDDYGRSLAAGTVLANRSASGSICDALLAPSPGAIGFALNRKNLNGALAVSDDEALTTVAMAARVLKLVVEPGGGVALAGLLAGRYGCRGKSVVAVLSGGNVDDAMLVRALAIPDASL